MSTATESRVERKRRPSRNSDAGGNTDAAAPIAERLQSVLRRIKRVILLRGLLGFAARFLGNTTMHPQICYRPNGMNWLCGKGQ